MRKFKGKIDVYEHPQFFLSEIWRCLSGQFIETACLYFHELQQIC